VCLEGVKVVIQMASNFENYACLLGTNLIFGNTYNTKEKFKVLIAILLRIQVVWGLTPCHLVITDVSKEHFQRSQRVERSKEE
jgi:hypothetical protein